MQKKDILGILEMKRVSYVEDFHNAITHAFGF